LSLPVPRRLARVSLECDLLNAIVAPLTTYFDGRKRP
jgi:hypothetical protein